VDENVRLAKEIKALAEKKGISGEEVAGLADYLTMNFPIKEAEVLEKAKIIPPSCGYLYFLLKIIEGQK